MIVIKKAKIVNRQGIMPRRQQYILYIIGHTSSQEIDDFIREKKLQIIRIDNCKHFNVNKIILTEKW